MALVLGMGHVLFFCGYVARQILSFFKIKRNDSRFNQFKSIVGNREGSLLMGVLREIKSRVPVKIYLNNLFLNKN